MTWILVGITLVALATAGALLAYVVRLARQDRDRSEARVAALAELLQSEDPQASTPSTSGFVTGGLREDLPPTYPDDHFGRLRTAAESEPEESRAGVTIDDDSGGRMFGAPAAGGPRPGHRLLITATGALVVGLALAAIYALNQAPEGGQAAEASPISLELLSMRHERDGDTLSVSGLVRIPVSGRPLQDVTAVVMTFDRQGGFLASGRSPIDFRRLAPGDESPFLVRLPGARTVGRYRVTFRTEQGVVPHVDRRHEAPAAVADVGHGLETAALVHQ
jgi:hypothetical protein